MRTAVILVTFNGWEMTRNCLSDMAAQLTDSEHFVVAIADNASSDGTVENLRKEFPTVHVYPSDKNLGFGTANNLAIKGLLSDGESFDSICLLNNDTRFLPNMLPRLQKAWEKAEAFTRESGNAYAVIAPSTKNKDGSDQPNYFAGLGPEGIGSLKFFTNALRNEEGAAEILQGKPSKTAQENLLETNWLSGVCWMFGKELYNALTSEGSFFDERIFMYYEDADLALRARKIGAVENHPEHVQEKEQKTMDAEIEENLLLGLMHHPELHHNQHDHDYDGAEDIYSHVKSHYRPK